MSEMRQVSPGLPLASPTLCRQPVSPADDRLTVSTAPMVTILLPQVGPSSSVDGAVNWSENGLYKLYWWRDYVTSATTQQGIVGSVHDCINLQTSNVTLVKRNLKVSLNIMNLFEVHFTFSAKQISSFILKFSKSSAFILSFSPEAAAVSLPCSAQALISSSFTKSVQKYSV